MAGMKTASVVVLAFCLFAVVRADDALEFSAQATATPQETQGGHLVDNGFQYDFGQFSTQQDQTSLVASDPQEDQPSFAEGVPQEDQPSFAEGVPQEEEKGGHLVDTGFQYQFGQFDTSFAVKTPQDVEQDSYDYTKDQFSTQEQEDQPSFATGVQQDETPGGHLVDTGFQYNFGQFSTQQDEQPSLAVSVPHDDQPSFAEELPQEDPPSFAEDVPQEDQPSFAESVPQEEEKGGHLVDTGFQYNFGQFDTSFAVKTPEDVDQHDSSFGDETYVYNANDNDTKDDFSTKQDEEPSFAVGDPQEREPKPDFVYDALAADSVSLAGSLSNHGTPGTDPDYVYDAKAGKDEPASFTIVGTPDIENKTIEPVTPEGDDNPSAASFTQLHGESGDGTVASTQPIIGYKKPPVPTYGCPATYWTSNLKAWPKQIKVITPIRKAFGGLYLRKNLDIVYGATTVFQALLDKKEDPFSQLIRHACAALLNSYSKPAFPQKPAEVSQLFRAAFASKAAALAQAKKFQAENQAHGDCK